MSPYDNLLLCQPVSSPLPLRYMLRLGGKAVMTRGRVGARQVGTGVKGCAGWAQVAHQRRATCAGRGRGRGGHHLHPSTVGGPCTCLSLPSPQAGDGPPSGLTVTKSHGLPLAQLFSLCCLVLCGGALGTCLVPAEMCAECKIRVGPISQENTTPAQ